MIAEKLKATEDVTVAQYLNHQLEISRKTQREIAAECGYPKPNIITMFKQGSTKVPISSVPKLARALGVDQVHFLRIALKEYMPEVLDVIDKHIGMVCTQNEAEILKLIREATKETDPKIRNKNQEREIIRAAKTLIE